MRPSRIALSILIGIVLLAIAIGVSRIFSPDVVEFLSSTFYVSLAGFSLVALVDAIWINRLSDISVTRSLPETIPLGVRSSVTLDVNNTNPLNLKLVLVDDCPKHFISEDRQIYLKIAAESEKTITYTIRALERGQANFGSLYLRIISPLGLWVKLKIEDLHDTTRVFPNFLPVARSMLVTFDKQMLQLGVHLSQKRGEGLDFNQLREFREGDALRQIDWKTTARYRKPISREYQEERDQEVIFLLDCSRRMRTKESEEQLSHFDQALNALLLTSYIALRQGDSVGVMTFGGGNRWIKPCKGQVSISKLINQLYDVECTTSYGDPMTAVEEFMTRHRKRALVVMLSNLREEDQDDLFRSSQLLSERHVVMLASLKERMIKERLSRDVNTFQESLELSGTALYARQREKFLRSLGSRGAIVIDSEPQLLHLRLVEEYLAVKRSGRL